MQENLEQAGLESGANTDTHIRAGAVAVVKKQPAYTAVSIRGALQDVPFLFCSIGIMLVA